MPAEPTVRIEFGQSVQDAATAASDIEDADAGYELVGQARYKRQDVRLQRREHGLPAVLRHHGMEARKPGIRHTAALA